MRALAAARAPAGGTTRRGSSARSSAPAEIAETVGNLLAGCPDALPEVRAAAAAGARARARALAPVATDAVATDGAATDAAYT